MASKEILVFTCDWCARGGEGDVPCEGYPRDWTVRDVPRQMREAEKMDSWDLCPECDGMWEKWASHRRSWA